MTRMEGPGKKKNEIQIGRTTSVRINRWRGGQTYGLILKWLDTHTGETGDRLRQIWKCDRRMYGSF